MPDMPDGDQWKAIGEVVQIEAAIPCRGSDR